MNFEEAEAKFKELQARVQRGEAISRAEYESQVSQLGVYDERGTLWEINPRTGKWMQFDGAEWVPGRPPGRDQSTVMPLSQLSTPASSVTARAGMPPAQPPVEPARSAPPPPRPIPTAPPARGIAPSASASRPTARAQSPENPEAVEPIQYTAQDKPGAPRGGSGGSKPPARSGGNIFRDRPWLPFAIGAVVLLFCAIAIFAAASFGPTLLSSATRTPTRVALPPTAPATVVRVPTSTPIPPTPVPVLAKITTTTSNVRSAPNTKGKIVTTLKKNNQVTLIGQTVGQAIAGKDVWYQINVAGQPEPAWIFSDNVQVDSGDPKTLPVIAGTPTPTPKGALPAPGGPTSTLTPIGGPTPTRKP